MSWIQKLYETYENCPSVIGKVASEKEVPLLPICHTTQKAHIELVIDQNGNFMRARVVPKDDARTIIPCTESSGGRTSGEAPHPLCDKLQYVAMDYLIYLMRPFEEQDIQSKFLQALGKGRGIDRLILKKAGKSIKEVKQMKKDAVKKLITSTLNDCKLSKEDISEINPYSLLKVYARNREILGKCDISQFPYVQESKMLLIKRLVMEHCYPEGMSKISYYQKYQLNLKQWCMSDYAHPKAIAVLEYIKKGHVIEDLIANKLLIIGDNGNLMEKPEKKNKDTPNIFKVLNDQSDTFIRWEVEIPNNRCSKVWEDKSLWDSWISYYSNIKQRKILCYVTGKELLGAEQHPAKLRHDGDKAKLISSNDTSGFTFRGRFTDADQACGVGFEVTQKAHSALRWLISRQGYRSGDQAIVAWATSGKEIPDPLADSFSILGEEELASDASDIVSSAQNIALKVNKKIAGYKAELGDTSGVVVMGLDSATPGRMAITFYRELTGSEFLERLEKWHETCAWIHDYRFIEDKENKKAKRKYLRFVGAPAPRDITEAAYGSKVDDKLKKSTVERLLPCIIDGRQIPRDIVDSAVRRACNRAEIAGWEWNKALSIACALYRKLNEKEGYDMALDENRKTRDYLYGRLLALADSLEQWALNKAGEDRQTNAARLMQRFADRPYSTWRTIELSLAPYKARLGGQSQKRQELIHKVHAMFDPLEDYTSDKPLSGEFLLGYHCQHEALRSKSSGNAKEGKQEAAAETAE